MIHERNEEKRKSDIYAIASNLSTMQIAEKQIEAAEEFEKILGYRDAAERAQKCREAAPEIAYQKALWAMEQAQTAQAYYNVVPLFKALIGHPNAQEKAEECERRAKALELEAARKAEEARKRDIKNQKQKIQDEIARLKAENQEILEKKKKARDRQKFCVKVNKYFQSDETQEGEEN